MSRLQQVLSGQRRYVSMDGRALLTSIGRSHAILNPGSELRKVLSPDEIEAALNGSLLGAQPHRVPERAQILLGEPARPVDSLPIGDGQVARHLVSKTKPFYKRKLFGLF